MRILYVEDDAFLREVFTVKLKHEFKGVIDTASSGKEAIKLLSCERPYDFIVSEFQLTKGSGLDLLKYKIKNGIKGSFIFFTCSKGFNTEARESVVIEKVNFSQLLTTIRELGSRLV
jgi:response regulator of citrate/malate metabolism